MKRVIFSFRLIPIYGLVFLLTMLVTLIGNKAIQTSAEATLRKGNHTIIIDAGHGGEDGGAVSCTGVPESAINLEIALRLNDLMKFLGFQTKMIRMEDISVYTEGESIAQKKISDLKERVKFATKPMVLFCSAFTKIHSRTAATAARRYSIPQQQEVKILPKRYRQH